MISLLIIAILEFMIFVTGTFGNILTCIAVFKNQRLHNAACFYVVSLAIADLLTCSVLVLIRGLQHIGEYTGNHFLSDLWISVVSFFGRGTLLVSFIHLAVLSLDRVFAVSFPFLYRVRFKNSACKIIMVLVVSWTVPIICTCIGEYVVDRKDSVIIFVVWVILMTSVIVVSGIKIMIIVRRQSKFRRQIGRPTLSYMKRAVEEGNCATERLEMKEDMKNGTREVKKPGVSIEAERKHEKDGNEIKECLGNEKELEISQQLMNIENASNITDNTTQGEYYKKECLKKSEIELNEVKYEDNEPRRKRILDQETRRQEMNSIEFKENANKETMQTEKSGKIITNCRVCESYQSIDLKDETASSRCPHCDESDNPGTCENASVFKVMSQCQDVERIANNRHKLKCEMKGVLTIESGCDKEEMTHSEAFPCFIDLKSYNSDKESYFSQGSSVIDSKPCSKSRAQVSKSHDNDQSSKCCSDVWNNVNYNDFNNEEISLFERSITASNRCKISPSKARISTLQAWESNNMSNDIKESSYDSLAQAAHIESSQINERNKKDSKARISTLKAWESNNMPNDIKERSSNSLMNLQAAHIESSQINEQDIKHGITLLGNSQYGKSCNGKDVIKEVIGKNIQKKSMINEEIPLISMKNENNFEYETQTIYETTVENSNMEEIEISPEHNNPILDKMRIENGVIKNNEKKPPHGFLKNRKQRSNSFPDIKEFNLEIERHYSKNQDKNASRKNNVSFDQNKDESLHENKEVFVDQEQDDFMRENQVFSVVRDMDYTLNHNTNATMPQASLAHREVNTSDSDSSKSRDAKNKADSITICDSQLSYNLPSRNHLESLNKGKTVTSLSNTKTDLSGNLFSQMDQNITNVYHENDKAIAKASSSLSKNGIQSAYCRSTDDVTDDHDREYQTTNEIAVSENKKTRVFATPCSGSLSDLSNNHSFECKEVNEASMYGNRNIHVSATPCSESELEDNHPFERKEIKEISRYRDSKHVIATPYSESLPNSSDNHLFDCKEIKENSRYENKSKHVFATPCSEMNVSRCETKSKHVFATPHSEALSDHDEESKLVKTGIDIMHPHNRTGKVSLSNLNQRTDVKDACQYRLRKNSDESTDGVSRKVTNRESINSSENLNSQENRKKFTKSSSKIAPKLETLNAEVDGVRESNRRQENSKILVKSSTKIAPKPEDLNGELDVGRESNRRQDNSKILAKSSAKIAPKLETSNAELDGFRDSRRSAKGFHSRRPSLRTLMMSKEERKTALSVTVVLIAFIMLVYPRVLLIFYNFFNPKIPTPAILTLWLRVLMYSNSAINPLLYAWRMPEFRKTFVSMFTKVRNRVSVV